MIVMKFGGSSVADREQIEKVLAIVERRLDRQPIIVSSAHRGMTDALIEAAKMAARGEPNRKRPVDRQARIAASLACPTELLEPFYAEIRDLMRGIRLLKELSPRSLDYVSSFGERMAVRCIADFLTRNGVPAQPFDAWDLGFVTDSTFGRARPLPGYEERVREAFATQIPEGVVPIVTGFIGKDERGEITTVGRNGSDLTATLLGAALGADEVQIWSDTDGVMTADPSVVKSARNIPSMSFDEAAELAFFGSRILHPSTLLPAMNRQIPVRVMNTNRPEHPGTVIEGRPSNDRSAVTSIAYKERQAVLTLTSTRMFEQAGFLSSVFGVLGRRGIVIDMISTSEVSVSMTSYDVDGLRAAIDELEDIGACTIEDGKTILVVVGPRIATAAGIGARILQAVTEAGVNIEMISFGHGSQNFSMLIDDAGIKQAVAVLHRVLFETDG